MIKAYRSLLKETSQLKTFDKMIGEHYEALSKRKVRELRDRTHGLVVIQSLTNLIKKANNHDDVSMMKIFRLFMDGSAVLTRELHFKETYESKSMIKLKTDLQFINLSSEEQEKVREIVKKICDKKPVIRYKTVQSYFDDKNSQKTQKDISIHSISKEVREYMEHSTSSYGEHYRELERKSKHPLNRIGQQIYKRGILIV